jgi:hypothetical protein
MRSAVFIEALAVGVLTMATYYALSYIVHDPWLLLFLTGMLIHLNLELIGANEWWCRKTYSIGKNINS